MKWILLSLALLLAPEGYGVDEKNGTVSGQVFIVTAGGQNIRLGDIEVAVYPSSRIVPAIEQAKSAHLELAKILDAEYKTASDAVAKARSIEDQARELYYKDFNPQAKADYDKVESLMDTINQYSEDVLSSSIYLESGHYFFKNLPQPLATTRTDADGNFSFSVPTQGAFVLAAHARRLVVSDYDDYYWAVAFTLDGKEKTVVNLANENMTCETSQFSLIHTVSPRAEQSAIHGELVIEKTAQHIKDRQDKERQAQADTKDATERQHNAFVKANFSRLLKESQARVLVAHPDIGRANSDTNKKFVANFQKLQADKNPLLDDPNWPERLVGDIPPDIFASEISTSAELSVKSPVAPTVPTPTAAFTTPKVPGHFLGVYKGEIKVQVTFWPTGSVREVRLLKESSSEEANTRVRNFVKDKWRANGEIKGSTYLERDIDFEDP